MALPQALVDFLLPWMRPNLSRWASRDINPNAPRQMVLRVRGGANHDYLEEPVAWEAPGPPLADGPFARLEEDLFAYRIFGSELGEPVLPQSPLQLGDTIGLVFHRWGRWLRLFFASRISERVCREQTERGCCSRFAYQTLTGHPEVGEEVFELRKAADGTIYFRLEAWSRPNLFYVRWFKGWSRRIQLQAGRSALAHMGRYRPTIPS